MPNYHINSKGVLGTCRARTEESCTAQPPFGLKQVHSENKNEVSEKLVKQYADKFAVEGEVTGTTSRNRVNLVKPSSPASSSTCGGKSKGGCGGSSSSGCHSGRGGGRKSSCGGGRSSSGCGGGKSGC